MQMWYQLAGVRIFRQGRKTSLVLNAWADYTMVKLQKRSLDLQFRSLLASRTLASCLNAWKQVASVSHCSVLQVCEMLSLIIRIVNAGLHTAFILHKTLQRRMSCCIYFCKATACTNLLPMLNEK